MKRGEKSNVKLSEYLPASISCVKEKMTLPSVFIKPVGYPNKKALSGFLEKYVVSIKSLI